MNARNGYVETTNSTGDVSTYTASWNNVQKTHFVDEYDGSVVPHRPTMISRHKLNIWTHALEVVQYLKHLLTC